MVSEDIDTILSPLASRACRAADEILDLRQAAKDRRNPGACVRCYFKIYDQLPEPDNSFLDGLKNWIESHVVVVVRDAWEQELERVPVQLTNNDLESYCRSLMEVFHQDRSYNSPRLQLQFEFA